MIQQNDLKNTAPTILEGRHADGTRYMIWHTDTHWIATYTPAGMTHDTIDGTFTSLDNAITWLNTQDTHPHPVDGYQTNTLLTIAPLIDQAGQQPQRNQIRKLLTTIFATIATGPAPHGWNTTIKEPTCQCGFACRSYDALARHLADSQN